MKNSCIYIHIPFCKSKCYYCDFNSFPNKNELFDSYVESIKKEISMRAHELGGELIGSIYFGGGTPTILPTKCLNEIFKILFKLFSFVEYPEITIESNPHGISYQYLKDILELGFNRISFGVQTHSERLLKKLGRIHNSHDIEKTVSLAQDTGFKNISIDMIFGIPGQRILDWENDLNKTIGLEPDHISIYNLAVEEGTYLQKKIKDGRLGNISDDIQAEMYTRGLEILKNGGYNQYEISNFAKLGKECKHNQVYWNNREYFGFGSGACSYVEGGRRENIKVPEEYIASIKKQIDPVSFVERLSDENSMRETVIMNLRLIEGIDVDGFKKRFNKNFCDVFGNELSSLSKDGLLDKFNGNVRLTQKGLLFSNEVFAQFLL